MRKLVEEELLPKWGSAWLLRRESEAQAILDRARCSGRRIAAAGDPLLSLVIDKIDHAEADELRETARLFSTYGDALREYAALHISSASTKFQDLSEALQRNR